MNEIFANENFKKENKNTDEVSHNNRLKLKSFEEIDKTLLLDLRRYTKALTEELISTKDLNQELKDFSIHDDLTHIFNRKGIKKEINRLIEKGDIFSILFIDLGDFKKINDKFGHLIGDEALKTISQKVLQESIKRSEDSSGRLGGDEFILILPNTGIKGTVKVKDRLQRTLKSIKEKNTEDEVINMLTADIGIAIWDPETINTFDKLIEKADKSMYEEKEARKEKIKFEK